MADELPTWMIAVIAVSGTLVLAFLICCILKCCCRRGNGKAFRWIDRLGIPLAKEGQPSDEAISKDITKLRITTVGNNENNGTLSRPNRGYDEDDDEEDIEIGRLRVLSEPEEPEPFKRLNQLGIPRAQLGTSPAGSRKVPNSPLPSPSLAEEEELSSDEEISIRQ